MDLGLTSGLFATVVVALVILAPVLVVIAWRRVRGRSAALRSAQRWALVLLSQAVAVVAVLVLINNEFGLYSSWDDLLGRTSTASATDVLVPPTTAARGTHPSAPGAATALPWNSGVPKGFSTYDSASTFVAEVRVPGTSAPLKVYVSVPPEYGRPEFARVDFPVVELFHGYPGSPTTWFHAMDVRAKLADAVAAGATPFVLVVPQISVAGAPDLECTDLPGQPQVATFLTTEVRSVITTHFRVRADRAGWAAMGYSEGGYCAAQLVLRHPELFAAGVDLSGYDAPESSAFDTLPLLKQAGSLATLLRSAPAVAIFASASRQDPQSSGSLTSLRRGARPPTSVTTQLFAQGGHNTADWSAGLPASFIWLSHQIPRVGP